MKLEKITLNVEGMSCEHCVKSVKGAVGEIDGVSSVEVSLGEKTVTVEYDNDLVDVSAIKEAIEDQGYDVV